MKVVFHVDERNRWGMVLANVTNMAGYYREAGEAYEIEVVANGAAVADYVTAKENPYQEPMETLASMGVTFAACANALRGQQIPESGLFPFVTVVPAGVVELARRQAEGFAYIRL